jgi:hypothetical protein
MDNSQLSIPSAFTVRATNWVSADILRGLARDDVTLPVADVIDRQEFLWNAMITEYDAHNLDRYLTKRRTKFSTEFLAFRRAWSHDEWNHYLGFRFIYSLLYNVSEDQVAKEVPVEVVDFDPIADFFDDEFKTVLALAYDEIATFKSYRAEFPFYESFGDKRVIRWFKRVTNDELNHFRNCMEIIRHNHSSRLEQVGETLGRLLEWDRKAHPYRRTFVLDHYWYSQSFLEHCSEMINSYLIKGLRGSNPVTTIEAYEEEDIFRRYRYL